ncbi:hypothetical protein UFOVP667_14 [uncultured Caudovirales phage]|uniref:Uncharacterized protein n=1 Tax=uncultured Caudovirales phage TaxID=2100421 RepID=A0A6J5NAL0_9CAUD|nr:hypothetical protein UFOVP667_14 [uncultured Caudovirales phage]
MALTTVSARYSVKKRLDIAAGVLVFDDAIDEFVLSGVKRLYPIAQRELPVQTSSVVADNYGEATVDLSALATPVKAARKVEYSDGYGFANSDDNYHHGVTLYVRNLPSGTVTLRIYGVTNFALDTVSEELESPVFWYAMSEFYTYLVGNKSKYSIYSQSSGARSVDNMQELADYYEQKANVYINDRTHIYGVS